MQLPTNITQDTHPIHCIADYVSDQFEDSTFDSWWDYIASLPEHLRYINAVVGYTCEVHNGGHHQYFWNTAGVNIDTVKKGLRLYGAIEHLNLFEKALLTYRPEDYEDEHFKESPDVINSRGYEEHRFEEEDDSYYKFSPDLIEVVGNWLKSNTNIFNNSGS